MTATDNDWLGEAACRSYDPDLFFPIGGAHQVAEQVERARQICDGCPVRTA